MSTESVHSPDQLQWCPIICLRCIYMCCILLQFVLEEVQHQLAPPHLKQPCSKHENEAGVRDGTWHQCICEVCQSDLLA